MRGGGNGGDRHVYGIGVVLAEMAHKSSIFESGREGDASPPVSRTWGGGF